MTQIDAKTVMALRKKTGAPMMDCKAALIESGGDMDAASDLLRKKGLQSAGKKADREAGEGLMFAAVSDDGRRGVLVEVACETDFVARNEDFQEFGNALTKTLLGLPADADKDALMGAPLTGGSGTCEERRGELVGKIGENIQVPRVTQLALDGNGVVGTYVHHNGKLGVLAAVKSDGNADVLQQFAKGVCLTAAAYGTDFLTADEIPAEAIEKERAFVMEQTRETMQGKPDEIVAKAAEGRMRKFVEEKTLVAQAWVPDSAITVEKAREAAAKEAGSAVEIAAFQRVELGA